MFYRGYLIRDRSLIPLTIAWATIVAMWLLVYVVSAVGPQAKLSATRTAAQASLLASRPATVSTRRISGCRPNAQDGAIEATRIRGKC